MNQVFILILGKFPPVHLTVLLLTCVLSLSPFLGLALYCQLAMAGSLANIGLLPLSRVKRQSNFLLPTDANTFLKAPMKTTFRCVRTGYFADIDNNCQMYHVCVVQEKATGHKVIRQYSFVCGNGTMFNQLTMNCDDPNESLPCEDAPRFYRLNDKIGNKEEPLHNGDDWESDAEPGYDPADYVGSASSARRSQADEETAEDGVLEAAPTVGRASYGSATHGSNTRYYARHRSSAGHSYAPDSRFRSDVRYYSSNRPATAETASERTRPSSYASSGYNTRYNYDTASSHTSETAVAAPTSSHSETSGSGSRTRTYEPDLSATAPGIYYYKRREVPYDI